MGEGIPEELGCMEGDASTSCELEESDCET